ncbi:hypothetical protein ONZ43_g6586 [Nemania bipapillata]|uniref:Uncharacterized protein n=1 Tax=Nemania bipapillata TaxID=110536 RepID=A0ACC2HYN3_9PEZI|nr:hypothetical protein ONZ43_g6586 [Nemania bipapillata]
MSTLPDMGSTQEAKSTPPPSSQTATGPPSSSFCQAIVFFYTCGCRKPEPVYCCQPPDSSSGSGKTNPCKSLACGAQDPGAKEFIREVDTAERLELAVLSPREGNHAAIVGGPQKDGVELPCKVEGEFTVNDVVSKSRSRNKKTKKVFSATATPFVPYVPPAEAVDDIVDGTEEDTNETQSKRTRLKQDEDVMSENIRKYVALHIELKADETESDDFDDLELPELKSEQVADSKKFEPNSLTVEPIAEQGAHGLDASITEPDSSRGDMLGTSHCLVTWSPELK